MVVALLMMGLCSSFCHDHGKSAFLTGVALVLGIGEGGYQRRAEETELAVSVLVGGSNHILHFKLGQTLKQMRSGAQIFCLEHNIKTDGCSAQVATLILNQQRSHLAAVEMKEAEEFAQQWQEFSQHNAFQEREAVKKIASAEKSVEIQQLMSDLADVQSDEEVKKIVEDFLNDSILSKLNTRKKYKAVLVQAG